jgi:nucleotide-binding universal stress UspA family protein
VRLTEEFQPQLVVIGARGEHGRIVAPAALGGTALKLLAQTTRPMLLVREPDGTRYRECLVAIGDSSELSSRIVEWGIRLAPAAVCHLIHAYSVPYLERLRRCGVDEASLSAGATACKESAETRVDAVLRTVDGSARVHVHLVAGDPLPVVLTEIVCDRAQLLVVGKHTQRITDSTHALVGSVGFRLAYHAPTDVLVVP